jgi:hypothetical protein
MNIKREAIDRIIKKLDKEMSDIHYSLYKNTREINRLSDEQRVLKRQRNELNELIKSIRSIRRINE